MNLSHHSVPLPVQARDPKTSKVFIVAQSRMGFVPGAVPKEAKGKAKDG